VIGVNTNQPRTTITQCRFLGAKVWNTGSYGVIELCSFENCPKQAIHVAGTGDHRIVNNHFKNILTYWRDTDRTITGGTLGGAIEIVGPRTFFQGNNLNGVGSASPDASSGYTIGVWLWSASHCVIDGNYVTDVRNDEQAVPSAAAQGILLFGGAGDGAPGGVTDCQYNTISNNTIYDCEGEGITLFGNVGSGEVIFNTVTGNTVKNCRKNGIELYDTGGPNTVSDNTVTGTGTTGFGPQVDAGESRNGIHLYGYPGKPGCPDTTISGNVVQGNYQCGIKIEKSSGCTVIGNICKDNNAGRAAEGGSLWAGIQIMNTSLNVSVIGNISNNILGADGNQAFGLSIEADPDTSTVRAIGNHFNTNRNAEIENPDKMTTVGMVNTVTNATVAFAGVSTGVTYSSRTIRWTLIGGLVFFFLDIRLSSRGTHAAGAAATITGLPFMEGGFGAQPLAVSYAENFTGLGGAIAAHVSPSASTIHLHHWSGGAGTIGLSWSNFTDTSKIRISGFYQRA
jgi:parallel beta-helix repeat protein